MFQSQGGFLRRRDQAPGGRRRRSENVSIPGRVSTASRHSGIWVSASTSRCFNPRAGFYGVATS